MVTINVNGNSRQFDVEADTPLPWVLRDVLGMTGTKFGCGVALCGACTVQLDGAAIRSCITPVSAAVGKKVVTIEGIEVGLAAGGGLLPGLRLPIAQSAATADGFVPNAFVRQNDTHRSRSEEVECRPGIVPCARRRGASPASGRQAN